MKVDGKQPHALSNRPFKVRWYQLYFLLAAFDVLTVLASLYLNHSSNEIFLAATATNRVWLKQLDQFSELGDLASAVNAPGNDVFDSHDVQHQRTRLNSALKIFDEAWTKNRIGLELLVQSGDLDATQRAVLESDFKQIRQAMDQMVAEAIGIFSFIDNGDVTSAGARMATMDRSYANVTEAINKLRKSASIALRQELLSQEGYAKNLRWIEYVIMGLALLMVLAVSFYGHRLAKSMRRAEEQRDEQHKLISEAKENLSKTTQRLQIVMRQAPVGIFETDNVGRCVFVNDEWCRISGLTLSSAKDNGWSKAIHPDDRELVTKEWYAAAHEQRNFSLEYRFQTADEKTTWVHGSAAPILSTTGEPTGYVGSLTDISAIKETEHNLNLAKAAAEEATRAKSGFLANMSHEIRTPMNGVLGMVNLLLDSELSLDQRNLAETAKLSGELLLQVVNEILDFSKIESGKLTLSPHPFPVNHFLNEVERIYTPPTQAKGIGFIVERKGVEAQNIIADAHRLRQILTNLIGNAIKFTPSDGAIVVQCILHRSRPGKLRMRLQVSDSGIGIAEERQTQVFEAFAQADGSTSREFGGTGLGLTIASELVKLMGGRLQLQSKPGVGSVFYFEIEVDEANASTVSDLVVAPLTPATTRPLSILLAEDNAVNQKLAVRLLEKAGHRVTIAHNGEQAVASVRAQQFDVVLMDIQMPILSGDVATEQIRAREVADGAGVRVPIIALTAHALADEQARYLAIGMDGYVTKPIDREMLLAAIASAVRG